MRKCLVTTLILSAVLCAGMGASAAVIKPVKKKPLPKKPPAPSAQLAGDNGVFGTVYSLRKDTPLYFRLKSAEYTTDQVVMGDTVYVPTSEEKLLALHFTIQNPQKAEQFVRWDSLNFTAVDSMNNNHEGNNYWGDDDAKDHAQIAMSLMPTQTINVITVIVVPAKGSIPKLMVLPGADNGLVLRYILVPDPKAPAVNKPGALKAPIFDPSDATGYTALEKVPGLVGTSYPYQNFDLTIEKYEYITSAVGDNTLEEGERFLMVTMLMKNESPTEQYVRWDAVSPVLTSTDGEELSYVDMFLATGNRPFSQSVKGLAEVRVRMMFKIPNEVTPKTLALKEGTSRTYEFEVK